LWRNWQTEACLVFSSKPRIHRSDFEAQIIKPQLSVLRPKPGNPPTPWFWGSTKKPTAGFEAKPGETFATSFEEKLEKTVAAGFEAKPLETIAAGFEAKPPETVTNSFEAKPAKTVWVVLRPNHSQTIAIGFEAQADEKPSEWIWIQTTHKPSTFVLRLNQEPALLVSMCMVQIAYGATRPLDSPNTEYPTCATITGPLHQVSYFCHDPRRCTPCRTCHPHTTRQANVILQTKQR
jgi:hypothetical protein